MGGEWSKAVGMIFNQKYSNGRGKLSDAMKDPATRALHAQLKGGKLNVKPKKVRGGDDTEASGNGGDPANTDIQAADPEGNIEVKLERLEKRVKVLEYVIGRPGGTDEEIEGGQLGGFPASKHNKTKTKTKSGKKTGGFRKMRATRRR